MANVTIRYRDNNNVNSRGIAKEDVDKVDDVYMFRAAKRVVEGLLFEEYPHRTFVNVFVEFDGHGRFNVDARVNDEGVVTYRITKESA